MSTRKVTPIRRGRVTPTPSYYSDPPTFGDLHVELHRQISMIRGARLLIESAADGDPDVLACDDVLEKAIEDLEALNRAFDAWRSQHQEVTS